MIKIAAAAAKENPKAVIQGVTAVFLKSAGVADEQVKSALAVQKTSLDAREQRHQSLTDSVLNLARGLKA